MTLKTQIQSDISDVFLNTDEFAVNATYNSGPINVIFDEEYEKILNNVSTLVIVITVKATDVTGIAQDDTFVIDGTTYYHIGELGRNAGMLTLELSKDQAGG